MKLSIRNVVFEVFRFLWENRRDLLYMVAAPVLALSIAGILLSALFGTEAPADPKTPDAGRVAANLVSFTLGKPSMMSDWVFLGMVTWVRQVAAGREAEGTSGSVSTAGCQSPKAFWILVRTSSCFTAPTTVIIIPCGP
jgi:hypothetical protein